MYTRMCTSPANFVSLFAVHVYSLSLKNHLKRPILPSAVRPRADGLWPRLLLSIKLIWATKRGSMRHCFFCLLLKRLRLTYLLCVFLCSFCPCAWSALLLLCGLSMDDDDDDVFQLRVAVRCPIATCLRHSGIVITYIRCLRRRIRK